MSEIKGIDDRREMDKATLERLVDQSDINKSAINPKYFIGNSP